MSTHIENEVEDKESKDHGKDMVKIKVDRKDYSIHRGRTTVVEIKTVAGVPLAFSLDQVLHGDLVPLGDDASLVIKGSEEFLSHPKTGSSS